MNYAAFLAVLMVLTFSFPVMVELASNQGVPRSTTVIAGGAVTTLVLAGWYIRSRVQRHREVLEWIAVAKQNISQDPDNEEAYFVRNDHLGDLLLRLGRRREAIDVFERYLTLGSRRGVDLTLLRERVARLRRQEDRE
ncbi:glutaminase [Deinobacterium chartae]|uniref:Glutaminase n=1 Tax=Deinobacterium chartae TaxID=521158 RepID=A0A841I1L9_9DEIO|nr:hypothetical protein [Deinobacterium chartae]MBB6098966.1 glutaminase [Deinobacterium chartae]